jgi:pimeloyl-ACP methyl ester carboxylesterase
VLRFFAVLLTLGVILFAGWLTLRRDDIAFEQLETLYANADSRYLSFGDGQQIHFRETGPSDAPVIVLVHGFAASLHTWEPWVAELKRDYRVVTLDLPGHGLSTCLDNDSIGPVQFADVIDQLVRALNIERFTLAGNSMGGSAAWHYALAHTDRLDALVLVNAAGWPRDASDADSRPMIFRLLEVGIARRIIRDLDMTSMIRPGLERSFADPSFVTEDMVERYSSLSRAPCHRDALLRLSGQRENRQAASDQLLSAIKVPTLVMHGDQDNVIPHSAGAKFASAIGGAEYKLYEGIGHLPQEEIATRSAADLRDFLRRVRSLAQETPLAQ